MPAALKEGTLYTSSGLIKAICYKGKFLSIFEEPNRSKPIHYLYYDCKGDPLFTIERMGYLNKDTSFFEKDYRNSSHDVWKMYCGDRSFWVLVPWERLNYKELR